MYNTTPYFNVSKAEKKSFLSPKILIIIPFLNNDYYFFLLQIMDSLHITIPGSDDPYSNFNPNKRASVSSIRSGSFSSPYEPSSDLLSFNGDQQTNTQRRPSAKKGGVSTFITKLYT